VVSASLAPSQSTTVDVSEGTGYLFFTKGTANGLKCRTRDEITVVKNETTTQTMTNTTVVVDLDDTANEAPLETITRRETKLTISNQSSVTLADIRWNNAVISTILAPSESTTVDVTEGTGYLYFTKGNANGLKCRTKETIVVVRNETTTQTMINTTVVVDLDDTTNEGPLETIAPPPSTATMTWSGAWTRVSDTIYRSNAIGDSANTIERLDITASRAGTITIQITASSESYDRGYASRLDTGVSTSNYQMRVSGTTVATYTYTIPSGSHWIQFMYQKDGYETSGSDNVTVEIISTTFMKE
jgi:hypothetical protein